MLFCISISRSLEFENIGFQNQLCFVAMYGNFGGKSIGSGTIIDKDGTILTCAHAVAYLNGRRISSKVKVSGSIVFHFVYVFLLLVKKGHLNILMEELSLSVVMLMS